jgi:[ribosomal protein S18]-alanine N-acetyltransferase
MVAEPRSLPLRIREMRQTDVTAVAAIERSAYEFPWTAGIFRDCLLAGYVSVVLEQAGRLIGYGIISVAAGEAHLLNLALTTTAQGQGHGQLLLEHLLDLAQGAGAESIYLEVRPSNDRALRLYARSGFDVVGRRRGYYRARFGSEDAVVLVRRFAASR